MALGKLSAVFADLSGKIGGGVHAKNASGQYVRQWAKPINPQSPAQILARNTMASNAQGWRGLTDSQRAGWTALASQLQRTNRLGTIIKYSGINVYNLCNNNLVKVGIAAISTAPTLSGVIAVLTAFSGTAAAGAATFTIGFLPTPVPAGYKLYVEATKQVSPGISYLKNQYRFIEYFPAATVTAASIETAYVAKFGALVAGQKIGLRAKLVSTTTGLESNSLTAVVVVAA